jgi:ABC-type branched-subunit amino acid transport system ATPase component
MSELLEASNLTKKFYGLFAVKDVSISIEEGSIHSVIGSNGAGKTTLFNLLSGGLAPSGGTVRMSGKDVTGMPPEKLVRRGLVRTFQITSVFPGLTVWENLALGIRSANRLNFSMNRRKMADSELSAQVDRNLNAVGLQGRADVPGGSLSHGERRALELGIGLGLNPKIMLLDEPMAGVSAHDRDILKQLILQMRDTTGLTVVLVEHDVEMVLGISDRITVMHQGSVIADGDPESVRKDESVRSSYLGAH